MHLEGRFTRRGVVAEQFLEGDDTGDREGHLTGDEGLASDGSQSLQRDASHHAYGGEDSEEQVREHLLTYSKKLSMR